ncbi:MAG: glycosyltransferase family 2 protein [bacterium]|nr:glycosyltransferase family 2 protein [bacterium]
MFSIVVPVYNETEGVEASLTRLTNGLAAAGIPHEVLVVDDGSGAETSRILARLSGIRVLKHPENRGYGAALKTGIRAAQGDIIGIIDADGSYPAAEFPRLFKELHDGVDMVVGVRMGPGRAFPLLRRPGKIVIGALAAFLVGRRIPDLNSGMRVMRRTMVERFLHLVPDGFSFTTTVTLAALTNKLGVGWVAIAYAPRMGTSTITFRRGLLSEFPNFLTLVVRIVTYFRPLRFFAVPSLLFLGLGLGNLVRTLVMDQNITDASILLIVVGIQIGLMGLLADLIVRSRR